LRPSRPEPGYARKQILVIDDTSSRLIVEELAKVAEHDYVELTSMKDWVEFRDRQKLVSVDGALVDLHLQAGESDSEGQTILTHLRDHTDIPAAMLSIDPPPVTGDSFRNEFRLITVAFKGRTGVEHLSKIAKEVLPELVGDEEEFQRHRMIRFLDSVDFLSRRRLSHPRFVAQHGRGLADLRRDYRKTKDAIEDRPLPRAKMALKEFQKRWPLK